MAGKLTFNPNIHHRRSTRLKGFDYAEAGLYFITVCCHGRACSFGNIENDEMILNEFGRIAHNEWLKTTAIRSNVELHDFVIMPNHIHGIIQIIHTPRRGVLNTPTLNTHENQGVCNTLMQQGVCNTPLRSPSQTIGAIIRGYKSSVTKQLNLIGFTGQLWQRNYYEHIIRNNRSYLHISKYIFDNPKNWQDDVFFQI